MKKDEENPQKKRKTVQKVYTPKSEDNKAPKALYRVKTVGFTEQYTEYTVAKRNYDSLKRKAIKEEKPFTIYLHIKEGTDWKEMEKAQIGKSFYEN